MLHRFIGRNNVCDRGSIGGCQSLHRPGTLSFSVNCIVIISDDQTMAKSGVLDVLDTERPRHSASNCCSLLQYPAIYPLISSRLVSSSDFSHSCLAVSMPRPRALHASTQNRKHGSWALGFRRRPGPRECPQIKLLLAMSWNFALYPAQFFIFIFYFLFFSSPKFLPGGLLCSIAALSSSPAWLNRGFYLTVSIHSNGASLIPFVIFCTASLLGQASCGFCCL